MTSTARVVGVAAITIHQAYVGLPIRGLRDEKLVIPEDLLLLTGYVSVMVYLLHRVPLQL